MEMRKIGQDELRAAYGEVPAATEAAVRDRLRSLPEKERRMGWAPRRMVAVALAAALALVLTTAAAMIGGWTSIREFLDGNTAWLQHYGVHGELKEEVRGEQIMETEEVLVWLTETARYGDQMIVGMMVQPKDENTFVVPMGRLRLDAAPEKGWHQAYLGRDLQINTEVTRERRLTVAEYAEQTGKTPCWLARSVYHNPDFEMTHRVYYMQEDGSLMIFQCYQVGADMTVLPIRERMHSISDRTMLETYDDRVPLDELHGKGMEFRLELKVPEWQEIAPTEKTAVQQLTPEQLASGGGRVWTHPDTGSTLTISGAQVGLLRYGTYLDYDLTLTGSLDPAQVKIISRIGNQGFEPTCDWKRDGDTWKAEVRLFADRMDELPDKLNFQITVAGVHDYLVIPLVEEAEE